MTLHEAVYCVPADAVKPLSVACVRHPGGSRGIGESCFPGGSCCYLRIYEAKRAAINERLKEVSP